MRVEFFIPRTLIGWVVTLISGLVFGVVVWSLGLGTPIQNQLLGAGAAVAGGTRVGVWIEHRLAVRQHEGAIETRRRVFRTEAPALAATFDLASPAYATPLRESGFRWTRDHGQNRVIVEAFIRRLDAYTPHQWATFLERLTGPEKPRSEVHGWLSRRGSAVDRSIAAADESGRRSAADAALTDAGRAVGVSAVIGFELFDAKHDAMKLLTNNEDEAVRLMMMAAGTAAFGLAVSDLVSQDDLALLTESFGTDALGLPTDS